MISSLETYKKENKIFAPNEMDFCMVCNKNFIREEVVRYGEKHNWIENHIQVFSENKALEGFRGDNLLGYIHDTCKEKFNIKDCCFLGIGT